MNIGDTDFSAYGGSRDGPLFSNLSPELPKIQSDALSHHTFAGSSPTPVHRLLSPTIDLSRSRRRTGFTPSRTGHPSPRLVPFPTPSPYRLRSAGNSPRTGLTPRGESRFGGLESSFGAEFMFQGAGHPHTKPVCLHLFATMNIQVFIILVLTLCP